MYNSMRQQGKRKGFIQHQLSSSKVVRGFTLVELLIVIGILVVLATVVVLTLNPAEIFRQARDSKRVSDLETLRSAIVFYLSTVADPTLFDGAACPATYLNSYLGNPGIDGGGWISNLNFTEDANGDLVPGGPAISMLPLDPINIDEPVALPDGFYVADTGDRFYSFICGDTSANFKLVANMESARYSSGGPDDLESTDGGNNIVDLAGSTDVVYETGTCVFDDYALTAGSVCDQ